MNKYEFFLEETKQLLKNEKDNSKQILIEREAYKNILIMGDTCGKRFIKDMFLYGMKKSNYQENKNLDKVFKKLNLDERNIKKSPQLMSGLYLAMREIDKEKSKTEEYEL